MAASTVTLQDYLIRCQQLLHDATGAFFTQAELTSYINDARDRLARDTGCLREYQTDTAIANQEVYTFATLANGANTFDALSINLIWGNSRVPLYYLPWTNFNAKLRYWQNYVGRPLAFSMYQTGLSYYLGPKPDQNYAIELDTATVPNPLVNTTDVDVIPNTLISPVAYYACHLAKFKEQAFGESEIFHQQYIKKVQNVTATSYQRRMFSPYATEYGR